ncbi:hypothetical protein Lcho_1320 [Leptothrix cholodnii SP-6]|uniref:Uncharacterized protein n=1 Tax=Leptothrix cholodnii (strain ATCC 51168 / LMG 8142 / SP-6) TaxID=395495 RepID=B1Y683_LEPCP|nr:hypothetical protein Lcho_1320 [Leptothrix cholodnii SP-6]
MSIGAAGAGPGGSGAASGARLWRRDGQAVQPGGVGVGAGLAQRQPDGHVAVAGQRGLCGGHAVPDAVAVDRCVALVGHSRWPVGCVMRCCGVMRARLAMPVPLLFVVRHLAQQMQGHGRTLQGQQGTQQQAQQSGPDQGHGFQCEARGGSRGGATLNVNGARPGSCLFSARSRLTAPDTYRWRSTSSSVTASAACPHDRRMKVSTAATSASDSACGGIP